MKFSNLLTRFPSLLTIAFLAGAGGVSPTILYAAEPVSERLFASPEEAIKALQTATEAKDQAALQEIFGPEFQSLKTGDQVQDADNAQRFAAAMAQSCHQVKEGDDKITLEVGTNEWPMPIPLVKADGQWRFDTAAGKEEIINRHIGKDELCAIGVCRAYVTAQRQYASANPATGGAVNLRPEVQEHTRQKGWPLLAGGGERDAQPVRAFGGGSSCRGLCLASWRGAASLSRILFPDSDPAGRGRARRKSGLYERRQLDRWIRAGGLSGTLGPIRHHDLYRQSGWQSLSAQFRQEIFPDCGGDAGIQSGQRMDAGAR